MKSSLLKIRAEFVRFDKFKENYIVLNFLNGKYYQLNREASWLFDVLVNHGFPVEIVLKTYTDKAGIIANFISFLNENQLIVEEDYNNNSDFDYINLFAFLKSQSFGNIVVKDFGDMQNVLKIKNIYTVDAKGWPLSHG